MELTRFKKKNIRDIASWIQNESEMVQWAGPIFNWPFTQKQFRKHLEAANLEPATLYPFGLYHRSKIVGYCELFGYNRKSNSAIVSRVLISPKRRNKGLGQFMLEQLLEFGFNKIGLNRISLGVFDFNEVAKRCYRKTGFTLEGTLRETTKVGTAYWNSHVMSILKKGKPSQISFFGLAM